MPQVSSFDCTEMMRVVMCDLDYFNNIVKKKQSPEIYADYSIYLVNEGTASVEDQDEVQPVTNLYFGGQRKVTDVIPVTQYPGGDEYPDDKIYLQYKYNEDIPVITGDPFAKFVKGYLYQGEFYKDPSYTEVVSGSRGTIYYDITTKLKYRWIPEQEDSSQGTYEIEGTHKSAGVVTGYQMYYKHKGQVLPISSSLIADVRPIKDESGSCTTIAVLWNNVESIDGTLLSSDDQVYTRLVTDEYVVNLFTKFVSEDSELFNALSERVYEKTVSPSHSDRNHFNEVKGAINLELIDQVAWKSID